MLNYTPLQQQAHDTYEAAKSVGCAKKAKWKALHLSGGKLVPFHRLSDERAQRLIDTCNELAQEKRRKLRVKPHAEYDEADQAYRAQYSLGLAMLSDYKRSHKEQIRKAKAEARGAKRPAKKPKKPKSMVKYCNPRYQHRRFYMSEYYWPHISHMGHLRGFWQRQGLLQSTAASFMMHAE